MSGAPLLGAGKPKKASAKQVKKRTRNLFGKLRASVNVEHRDPGGTATSFSSSGGGGGGGGGNGGGSGERKTAAPLAVSSYGHPADLHSIVHDATAHMLAHPEHGVSDGESGDESGMEGDAADPGASKRVSRAQYFRAAFLLMHARTGRSMVGQNFNEEALSTYLLVHSSYWISIYCLFGILHMAMGLLNANDPASWGSGYVGFGLEGSVIFVYALDTWLVGRLASNDSSSNNSQDKDNNTTNTTPHLVTSHWNQLRALLTLFFAVDLLIFVWSSHETYRVTTCMRPIMIVLRRREFRHMMRAVFVSATRIVRVLTLMSFHIVFFGFVAFVFFSTVNTERTKFGTLSGSILEMLLIVTSPGAVLAAMDSVYTASGGWGTLFFVIFVIIGNMVIYKVVLATAYRSFKSFMKGELIRKMRNRRACHTEAFELLTDDGTITVIVWRRLFLQMQEQQSFHWLSLKDHHGEGCCWGIFHCCACCRRGRATRDGIEKKRVKQAHRRAMRNSRSLVKLMGADDNTTDNNPTTATLPAPRPLDSSSSARFAKTTHVHDMLLHYRLVAHAIFSEIDFDHSGLIEQPEFDRGVALAQQASVKVDHVQASARNNNHNTSGQSGQAAAATTSAAMLRGLSVRLESTRRWLRQIFEFDVLRFSCFQQTRQKATTQVAVVSTTADALVAKGDSPAHHHTFPVADLFIDLIVILSCVSIYFDTENRIIHAAAAAAGKHSNRTITNYRNSSDMATEYLVWSTIGTITMVLFFAEVCLRVFAFGLREYLIMPMHKLDMFCVAIGILFFTITWLDASIGTSSNPLYNFFLVLRASRMIRLLWFIPTLRGMLWTVGKLVPSLLELLSILFVPMYMGASLGHIFLGECLVYPIKNPAINVTAPATAKLLAKWLPVGDMLQFDTPGRAMLDMFEMANIASWSIVMDAGSALCGPRWASPLFFFTVRVVLHMVFIPIIVGFIIEQFVKKYEWWEHHEDTINRHGGGGDGGEGGSMPARSQSLSGGMGGDGKDEENAEQTTTKERAGRHVPPGQKVLVSHPLDDGLRAIHVHVKKTDRLMEGAPSKDADIFNVSADIAAEQAAEQVAENIALKGRVEFLEATITKSQASLAEGRKKERKMQRQIDTLKAELKKRMAS